MIDLNSPNLQISDIQKILKKCLKSNWISTSSCTKYIGSSLA